MTILPQTKKSLFSSIAQFRSSWPTIGLLLVTSSVLIGSVLLLHFWQGIPVGDLTRDPTAVARVPLYTGYLSQIGILLWSASAAVCLFSARVLSKFHEPLRIRHFFIVSGILSSVIGLDDAFLLHETFFPHFGIPQEVVLASYGVIVFFYLVKFYSIILKTEYILLGMALVFFGVSAAMDFFIHNDTNPYQYLYEDGAKLVGIVSWLGYFFRAGVSAVVHGAAQQEG